MTDGHPVSPSESVDSLSEQRRLRLKISEQIRILKHRQQQLLDTVDQLQQREADAVRLAHVAQEEGRKLAQALAELRSAQDKLVRSEKLAAIGQIAAGIGHELRNPLGAIRNAWFYIERRIRAAKLHEKDERIATFGQIIDKEMDRCSRIIGELLDFSRERPVVRVPYPLHQLVDDAFALVVKPNPAIRLTNEVPEDLPVPFVDADQFVQVLVNLGQNAVESVNPEKGDVRVRAREENGWFTIDIIDNGHGIPPETLEKIFEPLFTTKRRGTGLGLAIVATILQRHGGTVSVKSELDEGTTFTLHFPQGAPTSEKLSGEGGAAELRKRR